MSRYHYFILLFPMVIAILCGNSFASFGQEVAERAEASSGLPLPRFASFKSDNVFVRAGPSMDYPIKWIYKKDGLPVEIIQEFDAWRKVRDPEGVTGWAHKILLSGQRHAVITTSPDALAYDDADFKTPVVRFEKGVIVSVEECQKISCRVQFAPYEGWIEKKHLWGVYGSDVFN
jgi:SH3-like domain-containing protein